MGCGIPRRQWDVLNVSHTDSPRRLKYSAGPATERMADKEVIPTNVGNWRVFVRIILQCAFCVVRVCVFVQVPSHGPHVVVFSRIGIFIVSGGRSVSSSGEEQQVSVLFCLGRAGTARSREIIRCEKEGWLGVG